LKKGDHLQKMVSFGNAKSDHLDRRKRGVLPYLRPIQIIRTSSPVRAFITVMQVFHTKGAARRLGCSETWIHKLVAKGKLQASVYDENGELVERSKDRKSQGQGLYFFAPDIDRYQPAVQRRPRGSKNKKRPVPDPPTQMA